MRTLTLTKHDFMSASCWWKNELANLLQLHYHFDADGPFVMNTAAEIEQALQDMRNGKLGGRAANANRWKGR